MKDALSTTTALLYGLLCHSMFVTCNAVMILSMYFGMTYSQGTLDSPWSYLVNALLLIQFPLIHSFMVSSPGLKLLAKLAPMGLGKHLSTTTYVIIAAFQLFILFFAWTPIGEIWYQATGVMLYVHTVAYACAWIFMARSMFDAGLGLQTGQMGWWAVFNKKKPKYPPLPTTGLFKLTRQPIYVSITLIVWTTPTWTPDQLAVSITFTLYCVFGAMLKEQRFARIYGEQFSAYRKVTPFWIPRLPK